MRAVRWYGVKDVRVETVCDPLILDAKDAILRVTHAAICGSDLHIYNGFIPTMKPGDILGHEFMGEVVAIGKHVSNLKVGDRVVVPFNIACGVCIFCQDELFSLCDNSNPNAELAESAFGYSPSGLFGYSHLFGGFPGGQAEYVRVPYADVGALVLPKGIPDEKVLFLGDILSTAYMAAENCEIRRGDTVAVWGCGPVGQLTIKCAYLLGAERVIAIDGVNERLRMAQACGCAEVLDYRSVDVLEALKELTDGHGPHACIDAVGLEAHGNYLESLVDSLKESVGIRMDRPYVLQQIILACRKGGHLSIPGVYGGILDKLPFGAAFNKGLTVRMGQTHTQRYMRPLLQRIERGELDPSFIITHRGTLADAPMLYRKFQQRSDRCIKVVLTP